ncbi:MAG: PIG-L family deacetylase [Bryobacterales bacterium]|nr:PIG-L family deacetylase [Bryobacterales bacterium]
MHRRLFCASLLAGVTPLAAQAPTRPFLERPIPGKPHQGKVLLVVQAHSDDVPLSAAGTVAKLIDEGYTGYLVRASNDDMGDAPGLGTPGTIGDHVLGNQRDNSKLAEVLGLKDHFDFNYNNHMMAGVSQNEIMARLIFLIRLLKVDTVVCWDPWAHDEENPDHYMIARAMEAASWIAGRAHDFPEHLKAGLKPYAVRDKYYFARRPEITRVVDITNYVEKKVDANRANVAKGPAGTNGSRLKAELARKNLRLPLLDGDDVTADRNYIREFVLARNRELGKQYGMEYAEAFHYIGPGVGTNRVKDYIQRNAVPLR